MMLNMGLRKKVAIVFIGMLVFAGLNLHLLHRMLQDFNGVAATATVAGQMRMLGQKLAYEVLSTSSGLSSNEEGIEHDIIDFEAAYLVLRSGGTAFNEEIRPLGAQHTASLNTVWLSWRQYRNQIRHLLESQSDAFPSLVIAQQQALAGLSAALLESTDALISELVMEAQVTQQDALDKMYLMLALNAVILMWAYLAMNRQIVVPLQRLARHCRDLAGGNYQQRVYYEQNDEIGQLARALNQSGNQIGELMKAVERERRELHRTSAMFQGVARNTVAGVFVVDSNRRFRYVNRKLAQMLGRRPEEMVDTMLVRDLLAGPDNSPFNHLDDSGVRMAHSLRYETRARHRSGEVIDIEIFASRMVLDGEQVSIGIVLDVTERKSAELSLKRAALVYANTSEAVVVTDDKAVILDINPAFTTITGYAADDAIGRGMNMLSSDRHPREFYQAMWESLRTTGKWSGDIWNRRKDGSDYIERLIIDTSYNEDGTVNCHICVFSDVTVERLREETIWEQAHFDHLTGLPNRKMFHEELQRAMLQVDHSGGSLALIYLDLDLFKEVNDSLGHDKGDELLKEVAQRLNRSVRSGDLVARLGGDEFTLILKNADDHQRVEEVCRRVLETVSQPYMLLHNVATVSASLGITMYPRDGRNMTELLQNADLAMYSAKDAGRNQFCNFSLSMQLEAQERRELFKELQHALDRREFELYFQPIVDLASGHVSKAEALLRWHHPERGMVAPADFIPLAEDSGLIVHLGDWVFRSAAAQVAKWRKQLDPGFQVSVNVSPAQCMSEELDPQAWLACLNEHGMGAGAVLVEITERVLMKTDSAAKNKLLAFRDAGVQVALDDFGTGYSSLAYLKRFDIDFLKIDQLFVHNITTDDDALALCQAMIAMAHGLGLKVVAEGVATEAQHELLVKAGCDYAQGFLYSRPVPAAGFEQFMSSGLPLPVVAEA